MVCLLNKWGRGSIKWILKTIKWFANSIKWGRDSIKCILKLISEGDIELSGGGTQLRKGDGQLSGGRDSIKWILKLISEGDIELSVGKYLIKKGEIKISVGDGQLSEGEIQLSVFSNVYVACLVMIVYFARKIGILEVWLRKGKYVSISFK